MNKYFISMAVGAIFIAFSPIVTRAVSLSPSSISFYRFFIGFIAISSVLLIKELQSQNSFKIEEEHKIRLKKSLPAFAMAGLFFSFDVWLWHRSIIYIGAGIATLLANTQVIYLALFGKFILKDKTNWFLYPSMIITITGIILSSLPFITSFTLDTNSLGIIYGLLTGVTYAILTIFLRRGVKTYQTNGLWPVYCLTAFAAFSSLLIALLEGSLETPSSKDLIFMLIYGGIIHFGGWLLISKSLSKLPIAIASLILLLQPVCATIFGHLLYEETLSKIQMIGLGLSLIGIYLSSISKRETQVTTNPLSKPQ